MWGGRGGGPNVGEGQPVVGLRIESPLSPNAPPRPPGIDPMFFLPILGEGVYRHRPHATAGLVAANYVVAVLLGCFDPWPGIFHGVWPGRLPDLVLSLDAFAPWTWITSAFVHGDLGHLTGNMLFLLTFGVIVEGVAGWRWMLALYFGCAFLQDGLTWLLFRGAAFQTCGASGAIYALIAIAWVWAPRRPVRVFYWLYRSVGVQAFSVRLLAIWWIGWQFLAAHLTSYTPWSAVLHLLGVAVGVPGGLLLLRRRLVDAEGEDWFSVRRRERAESAAAREWLAAGPPPEEGPDEGRATLLRRLRLAAMVVVMAAGFMTALRIEWGDTANHTGAVVQILSGFGLLLTGAYFFQRWWMQ